MIFDQFPSFFDALQADFDFYRRGLVSPSKPKQREVYHRMFGRTDPTRDWPQVLCSCSSPQKKQCSLVHVDDDEIEDVTPKKSSTFVQSRKSSDLRFQEPSKPLTTTIEKSEDDSDDTQPEPEEVEERFAAHLNLDQFTPEEITVQVLEDQHSKQQKSPSRKRTLEVRGRHSDHEGDEDEYECLEYVKRLSLPHGVAPDQLRCIWDSATGHVVVEAPLSEVELVDHETPKSPRTIPVEVIRSSMVTDQEKKEDGVRDRKRARSDDAESLIQID